MSGDLRNFLYALHRQLGGTWGGSGGGYGFPKGDWADLATGAGLAGADMTDRMAQTYVAAFWVDNLYQRYRNWDLVAVAWKDGAGTVNAIIKQSGKAPADVTSRDIHSIAPETSEYLNEISKYTGWARTRGGVPEDYNPEDSSRRVVTSRPSTHTTITGTGVNNVEDPYNATIRALMAEREAEVETRGMSGAEALFAQLETLSNTVSGGTGRKDWRRYADEAKSGGGAEMLDPMTRPGREDEDEAEEEE